ncbi:hypothetical protein ACRRTK_004433 [Alexandromys fortis]
MFLRAAITYSHFLAIRTESSRKQIKKHPALEELHSWPKVRGEKEPPGTKWMNELTLL